MKQRGSVALAVILVLILLIVGAAILLHSPLSQPLMAHLHGAVHDVPFATDSDAEPEAIAPVRDAVAGIGRRWDDEAFAETVSLYTAVHREIEWPGLLEPETIRYGPDPQQNFDLFRPEQEFSEPGPVFVFVHGNGLGANDWRIPQSEGTLLAHAGRLGATFGGIAVLMNYRTGESLSPASGAQDLGLVVEWLRQNIASYDGDPETIVVFGHSEGARLTATYLFDQRSQPASGPGLAAVVLSSGLFGDAAPHLQPLVETYEGDLVPVALVSAEYDTPVVEAAILGLREQLCEKYRDCPRYEQLKGHNHMSGLFSFGTSDTTALNAFIRFYHTVR